MKYLNRTWLSAVALLALASCADDSRLDFDVEKPQSIVDLEYLKDYDVLKSYVDRTANPNFKLGAGVSVADFNKQEFDYSMIASNFDEMTAGWEMKHGGVVQNDGSLSLGNVKTFIEAASSGGITVFGHTLCWHSNQKASYLNSLIAPVEVTEPSAPSWDVVTKADFETADASNYVINAGATMEFTAVGQGKDGVGRALKVNNAEVRAQEYGSQFFIKFAPTMVVGERYTLKMDVRADVAANVTNQAHITPGTYKGNAFLPIDFTTEWATYTKEITIDANNATSGAIAFNLGKTATNYYFDNIELTKYNAGGAPATGVINKGYAYWFTNPSLTDFYKAQIAYGLTGIANNVEYSLKIAVKASKAGSIRAELQSADYSSDGFGSIPLTTEWKEIELKAKTTKDNRVRLIISFGDFDGTVYVDNVTITADGVDYITNSDFESGETGWGGWGNSSTRGRTADGEGYGGTGALIIEKTPEEKTTIITAELERWIKGILEVTKDKVKAWDVVNEPMSDWPDPSLLKTGVGKTDMATDEFYWQDYLGKDYAVKAIEFARKYGNSNDILFINDYGLEGADQKKCLGLIEYIKYVDSQGVKVDGIGTQMHVTCGETSIEGIRAMLTNLAATGKLIKISELDMGYRVKDASENLKTEEITNVQHEEMAAFYKQIVAAYFELIPAAQRYGITVWSPLDSPAESSWRGGEPIGLWDRNYNRKHAYGSFADGLKQ